MSGGSVGRILGVCTALVAIHSPLASKPAKDLARRIFGPRYRNGLYRFAFNAKSVLFLVWATWWFLGDPSEERERWAARLADLDRRREQAQGAAMQELLSEGLIDRDHLRATLKELDDQREIAEQHLASSEGRGDRLRSLEEMREMYAGGGWLREILPTMGDVPVEEWHQEAQEDFRRGMAQHLLENTTPEERHAQYRKLRIRVTALEDGGVEVSGPFGDSVLTGTMNPTPTPAKIPTRRTPGPPRATHV